MLLLSSGRTIGGLMQQGHQCLAGIGQGAAAVVDAAELALQADAGQLQHAYLGVDHAARQHAPGQADGDQHLDGFHIVDAHAHPGCQAVLGKQLADDLVGKGVQTGEDRSMGGQLAKLQTPGVRQWVFGGDHELQRIEPQVGGDDGSGGVGCQGDDRQFNVAQQDLFMGDLGIEELNIQLDTRIGLGKAA